MNYQVELFSEQYVIVAVNELEKKPLFVLKKINKEEYIGVLYELVEDKVFASTYKNLKKYKFLLNSPKQEVEKAEFYNIDENYKFKVEYKLINKWIVSVFNNEIQKQYDFSHRDFQKISNSEYILKNNNDYQNKYIYKQKNLSINEIKDMTYYTDRIICEVIEKMFDCKYYYDLNGTLRISNIPYTEKEKEFDKNLNEGWRMYYEGIYTFKEVIKIYTKMNYSVGGFMEIFSHKLISDEVEDMSPEEIKKDIEDIINGLKTNYDC